MNAERYKQRSKRIAIIGIIITLCCVAIFAVIFLVINPIALKYKYSDVSLLNGGQPYAKITVNGKEYVHEYFDEYHRLDDIPSFFPKYPVRTTR